MKYDMEDLMDNSMNFSYMTRFCHNILQSYQTQKAGSGKPTGFYDKFIEKSQENGVDEIEAAFVKNMTMDEYKSYIYDKIAALPLDSSNMQDSISVHITDAGFEAMKNDPEYEKWVLDTLRSNFRCNDPWSGTCGGKFCVFYFGATKEEYRGESWRMGFRHGNGENAFNKKSEDSFWVRRMKRRKELLEQIKELEEKKAIAKRMARSEYYTQLSEMAYNDGRTIEPENCDRLAMQIFSTFKTNILLETFRGKKL
ncbi:MAG: hypothetical protein HDR29_08695 [Lachnospiraceae bacterium]|nr:hypothetical protein [Lachnospiraceae bacterium]